MHEGENVNYLDSHAKLMKVGGLKGTFIILLNMGLIVFIFQNVLLSIYSGKTFYEKQMLTDNSRSIRVLMINTVNSEICASIYYCDC